MKKIILTMICLIFIALPSMAKQLSQLELGIRQYKSSNYAGCMQTMQALTEKDPGNAVAHYYLALAYTFIGKHDDAVKEYDKVIALNPYSQLVSYSQKGKLCLQDPGKCQTQVAEKVKQTVDTTKNEVDKVLTEKRLESVKNVVNQNGAIPGEELEKFQDFSDKNKKPEKSSAKPTEEEIAKAYLTLQQAGVNPANQMINPETAQLNMMLSSFGSNQSNNNNYMNMMPYMMMQQQGNGNNNYDPQYMQAMLTNMMMPSLMDSFSTKDRD